METDTAATHISSSRCQWCAPRERQSRAGLQNKVNCGCRVTAAALNQKKEKKMCLQSAQKSAFMNKVLCREQKTTLESLLPTHLIPGNSEYTAYEKKKNPKHAWICAHRPVYNHTDTCTQSHCVGCPFERGQNVWILYRFEYSLCGGCGATLKPERGSGGQAEEGGERELPESFAPIAALHIWLDEIFFSFLFFFQLCLANRLD